MLLDNLDRPDNLCVAVGGRAGGDLNIVARAPSSGVESHWLVVSFGAALIHKKPVRYIPAWVKSLCSTKKLLAPAMGVTGLQTPMGT